MSRKVDSKKERQTLSFNPRARIIRTIGDRLIGGPETAVIELVKNSHDADANWVRVKFFPPLDKSEGKITVEDDGHGMTLDDIRDKWMEPATTDKTDRGKSPGGRKLLGSKGIGRFAAAKLGKWLDLRTTALAESADDNLETTVIGKIDWDVFDQVKYLSDIEFEYETPEPDGSTGTMLAITGTVDLWNREKLKTLYQEMRRMLSPLDASGDSDFAIYLDLSACTPETCGFDGSAIVNGDLPGEGADLHRVEPFPLLKSCDYEVSGSFLPDGTFDGTMAIHRGNLEPDEIDLTVPLDEKAGEANCGNVLVHLFIFDRDAETIMATMKRAGMGVLTAKQARQILNDISGVAIYRDRFRIRPYGDANNDWLTLDTRRVQTPAIRIGHNQISGIVVIDREQDSNLVEKSSREGLEEDASFRRLKNLLISLLTKVVEPRRYDFRKSTGIGRYEDTDFSRLYASAKFHWAKNYIDRLPDAEIRAEASEKFDAESRRLISYLNRLEEKQSIMEMKVTLGMILGEVLHEGVPPVAYIQDETNGLRKWWPDLFSSSKEAETRKEKMPSILRGLNTSADRLRALFNATKPLAGGRRGKPTYYNPNQVIIDAKMLFQNQLDSLGGEVSHKAGVDVADILGYRGDLTAAIINLTDNAVHWLQHHKVPDPLIEVIVSRDKGQCVIDFRDNGHGIPDEFRSHVFDVGFTLKAKGTGLGLSIAREALARSGGSIDLVDSDQGAQFQIRVPFEEN